MKKDIHNNFIKNGSLCIKELKVIKFNGDKEKIDEFLNGQITSDHKQLTNNELNPFIKLHRLEIEETNNIVIGNISTKGDLEYPFCSNKYIEVSISVESHDFKYKNSISIENWHAANKILGNYFMQPEDIARFRPVEINYDNLRVSFDKGCYRGQEIVARMKYLGIDRRRFCTIISNGQFKNESIKVIGPTITINNLNIFNAIIKRDEIEQIKTTSGVLEII